LQQVKQQQAGAITGKDATIHKLENIVEEQSNKIQALTDKVNAQDQIASEYESELAKCRDEIVACNRRLQEIEPKYLDLIQQQQLRQDEAQQHISTVESLKQQLASLVGLPRELQMAQENVEELTAQVMSLEKQVRTSDVKCIVDNSEN